jgi:transposase
MDAVAREALLKALEAACDDSVEARFLHRLHCALLVGAGRSAQEVAQWYADDPSSVARWVRRFRESGVEGLREGRRSGRPGKLGSQQLQAVTSDLRKSPAAFGYGQSAWNGNLLAAHLAACYETHMSVRQCQRLLRQLLPPSPRSDDAEGPCARAPLPGS